jgi:cytochrome c2
MTRAAAILIGLLMTVCCSRENEMVEQARALTGGEPSRGIAAIGRYGCGSCHEIPGIRRATGTVGPPLAGVARRTYLAGHVSNTPQDMVRWIQHPQQLEHGTAMPEMHVSDADARDIAAYLYTLR